MFTLSGRDPVPKRFGFLKQVPVSVQQSRKERDMKDEKNVLSLLILWFISYFCLYSPCQNSVPRSLFTAKGT